MTYQAGQGVILSLDVGTTSMRAAWFDEAATQASSVVSCPTYVQSGADGQSTMDAGGFVSEVVGLIDRAMFNLPSGTHVLGVGLSTFWHSLLGLSQELRPATPLFTWADRRAKKQASLLAESSCARKLYDTTGAPAHSSYWPAKLRWIAEDQPATFAGVDRWVSGADYLYLKLFGQLDTGVSMASGTGLFDLHRLCWSELATDVSGVSLSQLPPISDEPLVGLLDEFSTRWPLLRRVPWFKGIGDGACSNIGAGCEEDNTLVLMLGTSGSMRVVSKEARWPSSTAGRWCYRVDEKTFASGMALSEGGAVAEWASKTLAVDKTTIDAQVALLEPDAHGLTVLPYVLGMRSPMWREGETASIVGMTFATTPVEVYRALLESVGLRFLSLLEMLEQDRPRFANLVATGGGFRQSPVWAQIICDCIGRDLEISHVPEGSLRGAAISSLRALGLDQFETTRAASSLQPNLPNHELYRLALGRQIHLMGALADRG